MKRQQYGYVLLLMFGLSLFSVCLNSSTNVQAFSNGSSYAMEITSYIEDYRENHITKPPQHYGTHDFIAEYALEYLIQKWSTSLAVKMYKWEDSQDRDPDNCRIWYLLGTEIPDVLSYSSHDFSLTTACDDTISRSTLLEKTVLKKPHQMRFDNSVNNLEEVADEYYKLAIDALRKKDCQAASLYLGCVVHMIADAAAYWHLDSYGSGYERTLKHNINQLTNKKYADRPDSPFIDTTKALYGTYLAEKPDFLIRKLAQKTHYGSPNPYIMEASWMDERVPTGTDSKLWGNITKDIRDWNAADRNSLIGTDGEKYFLSIESYIVLAIKYSAQMLKEASKHYNGDDCPGKGEGKQGGQQTLNKWLMFTSLFALIALPSLISTLLAITYSAVFQQIDTSGLISGRVTALI